MKGLDDILQRLEFGLPTAALPLTKLSARLTRGQCLALLTVGARSAGELNGLDDNRLRDCVGAATAAMLRAKAKSVV